MRFPATSAVNSPHLKPLFTLMRLLDRHPHLMAEVHALSEGADLKQLLATRHPEQETVLTQ